MDEATKNRMIEGWQTLPDSVKRHLATEQQLHEFEATFGPIPPEFRWFLQTLGGGPVGSQWVDGIDELPATHKKFASESDFWRMTGVFLIGWDGGGNPYGIERTTGKLLVEDHDFGGIHEMAPSLESFLTKRLCKDEDEIGAKRVKHS